MNNNPPKSADGFGTAPFLPPPPSKAVKRDDRYAALESIAAAQPPVQFMDAGGQDLLFTRYILSYLFNNYLLIFLEL